MQTLYILRHLWEIQTHSSTGFESEVQVTEFSIFTKFGRVCNNEKGKQTNKQTNKQTKRMKILMQEKSKDNSSIDSTVHRRAASTSWKSSPLFVRIIFCLGVLTISLRNYRRIYMKLDPEGTNVFTDSLLCNSWHRE
jgi:hypothetical protein